jgi:hypothetical protein
MNRYFKKFSMNIMVLAGFCFIQASGRVSADCPEFQAGQVVGTVQHSSVNEASGIAPSRQNVNVLWVHNDSGDSARVFAMNTQGQHLGIFNLSGATAIDCEDIAIGPGSVPGKDYLYVGDIGDNNAVRTTGVRVYRVQEPVVDPDQSPVTITLTGVETLTLKYPDGARDAETLMVDPATGDIYVVSKRETYSRVYVAAYPQAATTTMTYVAQLPWGWATSGDISPLRTEIIIRGYGNASLWQIPDYGFLWNAFDALPCTIPLASEPQGEAIGFDAFGFGYFTTSEGINQPIYYFPRVAAPPDLTIMSPADDVYRLSWGKAGFYELEVSSSVALDTPEVIDVTGLTEYDFGTSNRQLFFRLKQR